MIVFVYALLHVKTFLFQTIQFSVNAVSISKALIRSLNVETVLFQIIQFSINTQFSSVWPIDKTLSGATTPGQSGPRNDGNEGVQRIFQSSSITVTSSLDCIVPYLRHSLVGSYPLTEMQSMYSSDLGKSLKWESPISWIQM